MSAPDAKKMKLDEETNGNHNQSGIFSSRYLSILFCSKNSCSNDIQC